MKYQFFGYPVPYKGKTIWEIVGNLKNFGIGRIIVADEYKDKFTEPHFYKIVKVQPLDTPKEIGHDRSVLLWAEYVMRGKKLTQLELIHEESNLPKYHLIPKEEEINYLNGITTSYTISVIPKYQMWPPLYKMLWEQKKKRETGKKITIPPLKTIIDEGEKVFEVLSKEDITAPPCSAELYKTDRPIEELYKEILILQNELGVTDKVEDDS